ncbi:MAG: hypothetical protein V3V19_11095 [Cocleimonas sp.]
MNTKSVVVGGIRKDKMPEDSGFHIYSLDEFQKADLLNLVVTIAYQNGLAMEDAKIIIKSYIDDIITKEETE